MVTAWGRKTHTTHPYRYTPEESTCLRGTSSYSYSTIPRLVSRLPMALYLSHTMDGQYSSEIPGLSLRPIYLMLTLIAGMLLGVGGLFAYQEYTRSPMITSYEACVQAKDSTIQERYPAICITKHGTHFVQPIDQAHTAQYSCPKNEWVDCMPSPNAGIKRECTQEFLTWAKANCPNFKGAAL